MKRLRGWTSMGWLVLLLLVLLLLCQQHLVCHIDH
jgi:hypothetical protein